VFEPKRLCTKCGERKYEIDFPYINGGRGKGYYQLTYCVDCYKKMKASSPSQLDGSAGRRWRAKARHLTLINAARGRSRILNVPFDLDDYREELGVRVSNGCEKTGIPFDLSFHKIAQWNSPSFDRIKPEEGYVYSNIRVICWGLNMAFSHWGEEQTAVLMQAWLDKRNEK
jgi:hypothetical protein